MAYRVKETGAKGGIIVSPLGLQKGAKLVATCANIVHVRLDEKSTTTEYVMRFLKKIFVGHHAELKFKSSLKADKIRDDKIVETRDCDD